MFTHIRFKVEWKVFVQFDINDLVQKNICISKSKAQSIQQI